MTNETPELTFAMPSTRRRLCALIGEWHPADIVTFRNVPDATLAVLLEQTFRGQAPDYIIDRMIVLASELDLRVPERCR